MSSIYFPAHVVILFRRIVNVVSTLSISNHYVEAKRRKDTDNQALKCLSELTLKEHSPHSFDYFSSIKWPQWTKRSRWNRGLLVSSMDAAAEEADHQRVILQSTLELPKWPPGSWSWPNLNLFSPFQPELNPQPHDEGKPSPDPKGGNKKKSEGPKSKPVNEDARSSPPDTLHQLLVHPALFDPVRTPRYPIVLCHGLYGFDSRGPLAFPSMRMHYWSNVLNVLRGRVGADVIVTSVPGTGSISQRSRKLDEQLRVRAGGRGVNFLAHSMGGLDCRHLISHIQPKEYVPLSLMSISTPHRGSPFMDWCATNIGIGKLRQQEKEMAERAQKEEPKATSESSFTQSLTSLPSSFTTLLLSIVDSPAYAHLTSSYLNDVFNPSTPDDPSVKYWSVAGRMSADSVSVWHPFWLPKMVLDGVEEKERERLKKIWEDEHQGGLEGRGQKVPFWADERQWGNDGLVTIQSAKWGEFLGIMEGCDHWEMRGARGIEFGVDLPAIPALGLGSLPLPSSTTNRHPQQTARGDGWGFGDWTRFVGAWKKNKADEEKEKKAGSIHKYHQHTVEQRNIHHDQMEAKPPGSTPAHDTSPPAVSYSSGGSSRVNQASTSSAAVLSKEEIRAEKRELERQKDDHTVRTSTDTLSVVFDWLIDRVPDPRGILSKKDLESAKKTERQLEKMKIDNGSAVPTKSDLNDKALSALAAMHNTGLSRSEISANSDLSHNSPSEMKRRMEREGKGRTRKKELQSKEDLERFYVTLARRMYDEGL